MRKSWREFGAKVASVLACLALVAACGDRSVSVSFAGHVIPGDPFKVGSVQLLATDGGRTVDLSRESERRLTLLFFGYTSCVDFCPMVLTNLAMAMTRLERTMRDQVAVVFVTTDPRRDTPEVVNRYLKHIDSDFVGLRGSVESVSELARSVGVYVDSGGSLESGGYDPGEHGTLTVALDSTGSSSVFWPMDTVVRDYVSDLEFMLGGSGGGLRIPSPSP